MTRQLLLGVALATVAVFGLTGAAGPGPAGDRAEALGPEPTSADVLVEVKFDEALNVRGSGRAVHGADGRDLPRMRDLLDRHDARALTPFLDDDAARGLRDASREARLRGEPVPDLASWYTLALPAGTDADEVLAELRALPEVAFAEPAPEPAPPPAAGGQPAETPDFTPSQRHFGPAAVNGIDADFSRGIPGARGEGIRIVDLEYNWNPFHEDLQLDWSTDLGRDRFVRVDTFGDDHGTAVFGELSAVDNGYGVTGGVPEAEIHGISPVEASPNGDTAWRPGPALAFLAALGDEGGEPFLRPGDVVLLEQQGGQVIPDADCPADPGTCYAPLEWNVPVHEAIRVLTGLGVTVVATGGNGHNSTDHPAYTRDGQPWFRSGNSSGSILVGAGDSGTRERLDFSNHGARFDLQGWGHGIVTTGYCTLYCGGDDPDAGYTDSFGGTSGAGPIVTVAVAAIQSYVTSTGQEPWTAERIRDVLVETGRPQGPVTADRHIGPLPDLRAALTSIGAAMPE
ncbi:S8 family serine peptidase [Streptomyces sp. SBT349]|uniref:S8 family serine peptidase n=1 Tax=Streptomyces sp. SBT349 TaxID=1580539 RepID=UPI00066C3BB5|nr:S8 family serine peptidase [Streptomyces sp. SBT349]